MIKPMHKKYTGFTIVELLIVIAVIAILATIVVVGWNGVIVKSRNTARIEAGEQWVSTFELYKSRFGIYPDVPYDTYCLGTGFPDGKCQDYLDSGEWTQREADATPIINQLKRVSPILPNTPPLPVGNSTGGSVGPYIVYQASLPHVSIVLDADACPDNWKFGYLNEPPNYPRFIECYKELE